MPPLNTLNAGALTSLERVKEWLGVPDTDSSQDSRLSWMINSASAAVSRYADRQFSSEGTATHAFQVYGCYPEQLVSFAPLDASSVTSVTLLDRFGATSLLASSDYQLRPVHKPLGIYNRVVLWGSQANGVSASVVGVWGFPSVPSDVENATIITAVKWHQRDENVATPETFIAPTPGEDLSLPYDARMLLMPYRRGVI